MRIFIILALLLSACTTKVVNKPTIGDGLGVVSRATCDHLFACFPVESAATYGDNAMCVQKAADDVPEAKRSVEGNCTSSQIEQCASDLRAAACPEAPVFFVLPSSCGAC